jgi:FlaA1/EpsC-like NDP-sugar epimerase
MKNIGIDAHADRFGRLLTRLPRGGKRLVLAATDLVIMAVAFWASFALRLDDPLPQRFIDVYWLIFAVPLLSLPGLYLVGVYRSVVRLMGPPAVIAMLKGATVSLGVFAGLVLLFRYDVVPRSSYFIYWFLVAGGLAGIRVAARGLLPRPGLPRRERQPVLIYGAGMAGVQLAGLLEHGDAFRVVGFLDDAPAMQGTEIRGVTVHAPDRLERLIARFGVHQVFLAVPSASRARRREIIVLLERFPVRVRTIPGLAEIVSGAAGIDQLRDIEADDLLGRAPVPPDTALLDGCIQGRALMVTGAGGSVGSELCRQIVRRGPQRIVLFERAEFPLYRIERELQALAQADGREIEIVPVLGDVLDRERLQATMTEYGVESVYHAAAYKHVPLVEANPVPGIRTNVFGTVSAVRAAQAAGVGTFVLVSTDKAVNPENVMGASKRLAELVVQALAAEGIGPTRLCTVRFGNVLDSSGSVVPVFRDQIRRGGPLTVTHPDVIRYFMTIPEAAQLILQAGAMAEGGDVFVLNMGEPVRVLDLAHRMVRLSGLEVRDERNPDGDIEIEFTGLRPGEKIYEELLTGDAASAKPTSHDMIVRAHETGRPWTELETRIQELEHLCSSPRSANVRDRLMAVVAPETHHPATTP